MAGVAGVTLVERKDWPELTEMFAEAEGFCDLLNIGKAMLRGEVPIWTYAEPLYVSVRSDESVGSDTYEMWAMHQGGAANHGQPKWEN